MGRWAWIWLQYCIPQARIYFKQIPIKIMQKKFRFFLSIVIVVGMLSACKKDKSGGTPTPGIDSTSIKNKINDSAVLYARDIYLWYTQIPTSFVGASFSDPDKVMQGLRKYSVEPGFSQPVDRWSFAMKQAEWDNVSSGISGDFGLSVFFLSSNDLRVKYVEKSSPAGLAGIRRGWKITKIANSTNITTSNADFIVTNVWNSTSTSFTFQKPDGTTRDITLNATSYQENPIFLDSVYTAGSKKVGYLVFNSFLGDTTAIYNEFQRIFTRFANEGVNEVAVDLRYNGGGYVTVQHKLANYLVNAAANGGVMMNQQFNDKYGQFNETERFTKRGTLNLSRVFFIVSSNTASASELLINNLKPYMDVKLVGPSATYGKPVGYFPIEVGDWYIFPVSFRSTNKNGEGNYFNGIALDSQQPDGLDKDWGDVTESAFASIIKFIGSGSFSVAEIRGGANGTATRDIINVNDKMEGHEFKGAVLPARKIR